MHGVPDAAAEAVDANGTGEKKKKKKKRVRKLRFRVCDHTCRDASLSGMQHIGPCCASSVPQRRSLTAHGLSFLTGFVVSTGGRGSGRRGGRGGAEEEEEESRAVL